MKNKLALTVGAMCVLGAFAALADDVAPPPISRIIILQPTPLGASMFLSGKVILKTSALGDTLAIRVSEHILNEPSRLEGLAFAVTIERRAGDGIDHAFDVGAATMRDGEAVMELRGHDATSPAFPVRMLKSIKVRYLCQDLLTWTRQ